VVSPSFPVIPLEGSTPNLVCAICEAPSWGSVEMMVDVMPVWSLADEDRCRSRATVGLCRECIARLVAGDALTARNLDVEYAPPISIPTGVVGLP
jgi:hypothetical protein